LQELSSSPRLVRRAALLLAAASIVLSFPARADWPALGALERGGARISALAVDLGSGKPVEQLNAEDRLTPASLTKLTVAAAALDTWAADKTFQTRLLGSGALTNGVISGDLIMNGAGDATLDHQALWTLAVQLKAAGITAITGGVVVNTAPLGAMACETQDRCDALARSDTAYNAPIAAIGVDYGNWCVDVRAAAVGAPAVVVGCSVAQLPVPVQGVVKTAGAGTRSSLWVERATTPQGDVIRVGGNIPAGSGQSVYRAMSDPALGTGLLLWETLREIGIGVTGPVSVSHQALPADAYVMAASDGLSLKEQLGRMLRFSNNYIADVLTLNLSAVATGKAPASLADAGGALSNYVARVQKRSGKRARATAPPLFSGSGLTPENSISADELVGLLSSQYYNTRNFPAFYGGLVVPRQAPFAFLRTGSSAWLDRVALKTGTMDDPRSVCGIAGYLRKKDGGWIAFAVMVNGGPRMKHVPLYKAMEAARADIDSLLARY
jgi:D-alanyl-D-alanine carboxypeptidase/D-alanyl-D-alanine-endopeptidase (penicillin-binding protein 4)